MNEGIIGRAGEAGHRRSQVHKETGRCIGYIACLVRHGYSQRMRAFAKAGAGGKDTRGGAVAHAEAAGHVSAIQGHVDRIGVDPGTGVGILRQRRGRGDIDGTSG